MDRLRHIVESHFSGVLLIACALGMVLPGIGDLPDETAVVVLAMLMFSSCFKLKEGGFHALSMKMLGSFTVIRYLLLPGVLWLITVQFFPQYAVGVFLLATLPAGVSTPALASLFNGRVAPGFAIVIISQLITPLLIPAQFAWLTLFDGGVEGPVIPSPYALFRTMLLCIVLPMSVYYCFRNRPKLSEVMQRESKLISVLLVAFVIAMVVAKQRELLLAEGWMLLVAVVLAASCYTSFMLLGWYLSKGQPRDVRITVATCSMFNNAALGVSLALLHFDGVVVLFIAVAEMTWATLPVILSAFLRRV